MRDLIPSLVSAEEHELWVRLAAHSVCTPGAWARLHPGPKKHQSQGGRGHGPQWPSFWRKDRVLQENNAKTLCFLQIKLYCHFQKVRKVVAPICNPLKLLISLERCVIIPMVFSFPSHS